MATANKPLFKNLYFKRKVADSQARACFICCKPTTAVLVTENGSVSFLLLLLFRLYFDDFTGLDSVSLLIVCK